MTSAILLACSFFPLLRSVTSWPAWSRLSDVLYVATRIVGISARRGWTCAALRRAPNISVNNLVGRQSWSCLGMYSLLNVMRTFWQSTNTECVHLTCRRPDRAVLIAWFRQVIWGIHSLAGWIPISTIASDPNQNLLTVRAAS